MESKGQFDLTAFILESQIADLVAFKEDYHRVIHVSESNY